MTHGVSAHGPINPSSEQMSSHPSQDIKGMKEIIEDARIEDRNHFKALVPRIYELGGKLPEDIRTFADRSKTIVVIRLSVLSLV